MEHSEGPGTPISRFYLPRPPPTPPHAPPHPTPPPAPPPRLRNPSLRLAGQAAQHRTQPSEHCGPRQGREVYLDRQDFNQNLGLREPNNSSVVKGFEPRCQPTCVDFTSCFFGFHVDPLVKIMRYLPWKPRILKTVP